MNKSLSRISTLTKRNILEIIRDPLSLIFTILMPLALEIIFYAFFHKMTDQFQMKYLAPGIVVFSQSFIALFMGTLIANDKNTSFLTRLYVSKAKSYEFVISYALSVLPIVLTQSILFFLVGGIIDTSLFNSGTILAILLSLVTSLFFIAIGILFGSSCSEKSIGGICSIVISMQSFLSGMWFPAEGLGDKTILLMKILPFKNATMLIQNVSIGISNALTDFVYPLLIVLGYTLVLFVIAIAVYKQKMKEK